MSNENTQTSRSKIWLFRIILYCVIPIILVTFLELGLKVFNYGDDLHFVVKDTTVTPAVYRQNKKFTKPSFDKLAPYTPQPFAFAEEKPAQSYRIFILGESAAEGVPNPRFSFSRILEVLLNDQYPNAQFEVINASISAINSHVILNIMRDLSKFETDLFIIYMGHNEMVGPYGPGSVFAPFSENLFLIRSSIFLNSTRIGQLVKSLIMKLPGQEHHNPKHWGGLTKFLEHQLHPDDPSREKVYAFFQDNLQEIVRMAKKSNASIGLCTIGSNLKNFGPFASAHKTNFDQKKWDIFYRAAIQDNNTGKLSEAIENYRKALQVDDQYAEAYFRLGRAYYALSQYDLAKGNFAKAKENDALVFRAPKKINAIIKDVAAQQSSENVFLIDTNKALIAQSPFGIPGKKLFYEHVHLNFRGNYTVAKEIFSQVNNHLPSWVMATQKESKPLLTYEQTALRIAHTGYDRGETILTLMQLIQRPLFKNVLNQKRMLSDLSTEFDALQKYTQPEGLLESASQYRQALIFNPTDKWFHYNLGRILIELEEYDEAVLHLQKALDQMPEYRSAQVFIDMAENLKKE